VRAGSRGSADSRPGRRTTRSPARTTPVRRGPRFTGRAVLLAGMVLLLALTLAGPLRQYVAGREALAELAAEQAALSQRAADLQLELAQRSDPAYIEQQARQRLTLVPPGSRLVIIGDAGDPGDAAQAPAGAPGRSTPLPWYQALLGSVAAADG
jgi:cell division protein FtsB